MEKTYKLVQEKTNVAVIGKDGNLTSKRQGDKMYLREKNGEALTSKYECMIHLDHGQHFAVCCPVTKIKYTGNRNKKDMLAQGEYELKTEIKWGVIDVYNSMVPGEDNLVFPCVYDSIVPGCSGTAIAYHNGFATYLDIDRSSPNYRRQLTPCVLSRPGLFGAGAPGFAECYIGETPVYLPRNCKPMKTVQSSSLLTYSDVFYLNSYFSGHQSSEILSDEVKTKYFELTGVSIRMQEEQDRMLKKVMQYNDDKKAGKK